MKVHTDTWTVHIENNDEYFPVYVLEHINNCNKCPCTCAVHFLYEDTPTYVTM